MLNTTILIQHIYKILHILPIQMYAYEIIADFTIVYITFDRFRARYISFCKWHVQEITVKGIQYTRL